MFIRTLTSRLISSLEQRPAVAILGPRQVGKTTLALKIAENHPSVYLDLESPVDVAKLQDPIAYLTSQAGKLIILDEIQRMPALFNVLRGLIDKGRQEKIPKSRFLILGSVSIDLLKQSSESLAGRITYLELTGLNLLEVDVVKSSLCDRLWYRGGFPESYTASSDHASSRWREDFIRTYLERDIPQLGPRVPAMTLRRFWTMLAHLQSTLINNSRLASSLDMSSTTVARYLDLLVDLLLVRRLQPWHNNLGKRLVKSPKIYLRDSGLLHQLLGIANIDSLLGHPVVGASWEGFVIEQLLSIAPSSVEAFFYRSSGGAEIDLLLRLPDNQLFAIEIKRTSAPKVARGYHEACESIRPTHRFLVYNGDESFPLPYQVTAVRLWELMKIIQKIVD